MSRVLAPYLLGITLDSTRAVSAITLEDEIRASSETDTRPEDA
jgi:hypothetical protein